MSGTTTIHERLFRDTTEEPLAGPRRDLDPWIVTYGWVDNWVLDMCDRREPPAWMQDAPAPRPMAARIAALIARVARRGRAADSGAWTPTSRGHA
jgi:hypothetical protein